MNLTPTPIDRLVRSRERFRQALWASRPLTDNAARPAASGPFSALLDQIKAIPGANVVMDAVRTWWAQHPLRVVVALASDAVKAVVSPVAQRHPLGLVLSALLLGGLIAWSRPWRWKVAPTLFAGLLPQVLVKFMAEVPPISWLDLLNSLVQQPPGSQKEASPQRES